MLPRVTEIGRTTSLSGFCAALLYQYQPPAMRPMIARPPSSFFRCGFPRIMFHFILVRPFPRVATLYYESPAPSLRGGEKKTPGVPALFENEGFFSNNSTAWAAADGVKTG